MTTTRLGLGLQAATTGELITELLHRLERDREAAAAAGTGHPADAYQAAAIEGTIRRALPELSTTRLAGTRPSADASSSSSAEVTR